MPLPSHFLSVITHPDPKPIALQNQGDFPSRKTKVFIHLGRSLLLIRRLLESLMHTQVDGLSQVDLSTKTTHTHQNQKLKEDVDRRVFILWSLTEPCSCRKLKDKIEEKTVMPGILI